MALGQRGMGDRYVAVEGADIKSGINQVEKHERRGWDVKCDICGSCGAVKALAFLAIKLKSFRLFAKGRSR